MYIVHIECFCQLPCEYFLCKFLSSSSSSCLKRTHTQIFIHTISCSLSPSSKLLMLVFFLHCFALCTFFTDPFEFHRIVSIIFLLFFRLSKRERKRGRIFLEMNLSFLNCTQFEHMTASSLFRKVCQLFVCTEIKTFYNYKVFEINLTS